MRGLDAILQDAVNSLSDGTGLRALRTGIFALLAASVFGLYIHSQFRGLTEPDAMELAQIGRNLAQGRGFSTDCLRPVDLRDVSARGHAPGAARTAPDLRHAPVWPAVLAVGLAAVRPSYRVSGRGGGFAPERRVVVPLGILCTALTGVFLYRMGRRLFDPRTAGIAVALYFLTEAVLRDAVSGLPISLATTFATAATVAAWAGLDRLADGRRMTGCVARLCVSAALAALCFLTLYRLFVVAVGIGSFVWFEARARRGALLGIFALVFCLTALPWAARNVAQSGNPLGHAGRIVYRDLGSFADDAFDRQNSAHVSRAVASAGIKQKFIAEFPRVMDGHVRSLGTGLLACLFLVSLFHRFDDGAVGRYRWSQAFSLLVLCVGVSLGARSDARMLNVFLPFIIVYGVAFFFVLIERGGFFDPGWSGALTGVLAGANALPLVFTLAGGVPAAPYPPYFPPFIAHVCSFLTPEETLCTDVPWACAWYGNRRSLLLPRTVGDMNTLRERGVPIAGVYLTTRTTDRPYAASLISGAENSWMQVLVRRPPDGFPFTEGFWLPPGGRDQLFLTDATHWAQQGAGRPP